MQKSENNIASELAVFLWIWGRQYGQLNNYDILYFSFAYATQNSYWLRSNLIDNLMF